MSLTIIMSTPFVLGLLLGTQLPLVSGIKHHLFVSNLSPPSSIYALEFDDETLDFRVTNNLTADAPHSWMTFNVRPIRLHPDSLLTHHSTIKQTSTAPRTAPPG